MRLLCHLMWSRWFKFLVIDFSILRFWLDFASVFPYCLCVEKKKSNLPTLFYWACNPKHIYNIFGLKSVNLAASFILRHVFKPLWNLFDRFYMTFKSVALWKLSDMKIVPSFFFLMEIKGLSDMNFKTAWNQTGTLNTSWWTFQL